MSQDLPQHPGVGTHGTAGGVVTGVGKKGRFAGTVQDRLEGFVRLLGQTGVMELVAAFPYIGSQLIGFLSGIGTELVGGGNDHHATAGNIGIVADIAHMPAGTEDAGVFFHLIHVLVDGAHRFISRNTLLAAQDQRQFAVNRSDAAAVLQQFQQVGADKVNGLLYVSVR